MKRIFTVLVAMLIFASAAYAEEIRVNGGGAAINTVFRPVKAEFEKKTGIKLVILQSTPKGGLADLVQGRADAAVAAVPLSGMIAGAEKDGVKVDAAALQQVEIGKNRTVVLLHKSNSVAKLSKEQLKGIFTGKISNWKEVGGKDMPVIVVWGKASPGQNAQFTQEILDGEAVTKDVLDVTDYASIRETVASNPEAIGIDPIGLVDDAVRFPEMPEITSPVIMVTKGTPSASVQKLIDFVKGEGQKLIKK